MLSLVALGFNLIFNVSKVFHIAHGALYVIPAYIVALVVSNYQVTNFFSNIFLYVLAIGVSILVIYIIEISIYRPLLKSKANPVISLISSLGVYLVIINILSFFFGNESISLSNDFNIIFKNAVFKLTKIELTQFIIGSLILTLIYLFSKTDSYRNIKAVSDNELVAQKFGISLNNTRLVAMIVGTILVSIAGLLKATEVAVDPHSGMSITLLAAVAVIIGGTRSLKGTVIACIVIALIENYSVLILSSKWKEAITYIILLAVLLFYQRGLVSVKQRVETR